MTTAAQNFNDLHSYNALRNNRNETIVDYLDLQISRKCRRFLGLALAIDNRFNTCFRLALRYSLSAANGKAAVDAAAEYRARVREYLASLYGVDEDRVIRINNMIVRWANAN